VSYKIMRSITHYGTKVEHRKVYGVFFCLFQIAECPQCQSKRARIKEKREYTPIEVQGNNSSQFELWNM